jgi:hypothetical protein
VCDAPPDDPQSNLWTITNLRHSGLMPLDEDTVRAYYRDASQSLFESLTARASGNMWVTGPPGVGKSLTIFGWLMHQASVDINKSVCWVHCSGPEALSVDAILVVGGVASYAVIPMISFAESVSSIVRSYAIDIVVLDGLIDAMRRLYLNIFDQEKRRTRKIKLIGCISYKSAGFSGELSVHLDIRHIPVWSWTQSDYASALALKMFGAEVTAELLEEAIFYGGGSMRAVSWALRDKNQLIDFLDYNLAKVTNFEVLLGGLGHFRAPAAVYNIMQVLEDETCTLLSEYIAKKLSGDECANAFVMEARNVCHYYPAWQGWVLAMEFIARVKQCRKEKKPFVLERTARSRSPPYVRRAKSFTISVVDDRRFGTVEREVSGMFHLPQRWTHGCYDGVYYLRSDDAIHHFWFFQCRVSSTTRRYRLQHVSRFLEARVPLPPGRSSRSKGTLVQRGRSDVRVHFYVVVGTKESAENFVVDENDIDNIESVQSFDPAFEESSIKVAYLQSA